MGIKSYSDLTSALTGESLNDGSTLLSGVYGGESQRLHAATVVAVQGLADQLWMTGVMVSAVVDVQPPPPFTEVVLDGSGGGSPAPYDYTVPPYVFSIRFRAWGASGGAGVGYAPANTLVTGGGAYVSGEIPVVEGDVVRVEVGRGGGGARWNGGKLRRGLGGWPDGVNGRWFEGHGCFEGGHGGSTRIYLNGLLIARAGGSAPTAGFPAEGSGEPATDTYVHPMIGDGVALPGKKHVPGGLDATVLLRKAGWGVLNPAPDSQTAVDGNNGLVILEIPDV